MTILIAPGTSRTNSYVIDALLAQDSQASLRLLAHSAHSESILKKKYPSVDTVVADFMKRSALESAMSDVKVVFLNLPLSENSVQVGKNAIDAAKKARVERIVFCSVLHPFISKMRHHRQKLEYVHSPFLTNRATHWSWAIVLRNTCSSRG